MHDPDLAVCPKCRNGMALGFASVAFPLSFVPPSNLRRLVSFRGNELGQRPLLSRLFTMSTKWYHAYACERCGVYVVEFHRKLSRTEARGQAGSLEAGNFGAAIPRTKVDQLAEKAIAEHKAGRTKEAGFDEL